MATSISLDINKTILIESDQLNRIYLSSAQYKQFLPKYNEYFQINNLELICQLKLSNSNEFSISRNLFDKLFNNNKSESINIKLTKVDELTPVNDIQLEVNENSIPDSVSSIEIIWNFKRLYMNQVIHVNDVYSVKNYKKQLVQVKLVEIKSKLDKKLNYGQLTAKVETNLEFVNLPNTDNSEKDKIKLREKTEWINSLKDSIPGLEEYSEVVIDTLNEIQDLETSQGIIITGNVGIGKTYFCKKIVEHSNLKYKYLDCKFLLNQGLQKSFNDLVDCFSLHEGKSIIVLDDIDLVCSNQNKAPYNSLNSCLEELIEENLCYHVIIGITSDISKIDTKFLGEYRLDKVIEFRLPQIQQRRTFIQKFWNQHTFIQDLLSKWNIKQTELIEELSQRTHGYSFSDLLNLFNTFILFISSNESGEDPMKILNQCLLKWNQPNQNDKFHTKIPEIHLNECYGLEKEIQTVKELIYLPFDAAEYGIMPPKGIIFHGVSGVGKTRLCHAIANDFNMNYVFIESTQLKSKKVGESEKNVAKLFQQCRQLAPCLLFIDQIDGLLSKRSEHNLGNYQNRLLNTFLTEMDGLFSHSNDHPNKAVIVIATTNELNRLDSAILRTGRLDIHLELKLPNTQQREIFIQSKLSKLPHQLTSDQIQDLIDKSQGFSGSDIDQWIQEACLNRLNSDLNSSQVFYDDFINCINKFQ